ncbi:uncharacterized protein LOC133178120 [Saccostrea echinata]|uniref:uncharacterized protein LOC133178120 n=1 Tax=Saccostrea echinata TaxID=191078 RepID=UPI002A7FEB2C|nr:uncharacterized protein LOC133178120 [Saccostrea echinata]
MSNVKVAVRVRPLSQREKDGNSKSIVEVHGDSLSILNAKVEQYSEYGDSREKIKHFTFDYCYDSSGAPQSPGYASQQLVFQDLGTEILQAAFEGYNACLFAYGQTSTGKTYTMMGAREDYGITPRICEGLFSHVDDCLSENVTFRVDISYLEIYNERVKDLLRPTLLKPKEKFTLKVREHPKEGPYVQDLSSHPVKDNSEIQDLLDRGNESRTTASTYMHDRSSRSHAIVTITFTQAKLEDDLPHEIVSKIHLVDLAGSERADPNFSEHYKGRLKEGANINRSLVTLGNVIKALAERSLLSWSADNLGSTQSFLSAADSSPKRVRLPYIPYRDSVLTWLLKDSLGGNSKTIMIATITPASMYYSETISTLRYAQRAKSIINKPKINEDCPPFVVYDPNVSLIRELRQEIERLRELLKSAQMGSSQMSELNLLVQMHDMMTETQKSNSQQASAEVGSVLAERLLDHENMAKKLTQTWKHKWTEAPDFIKESDLSIRGLKHSSSMGVMIESQMPHLVGMDDDILSTGVTIYHLKEGKTLVGREDAERPQDIVLRGPGVKQEHCFFKIHYGTVTLHPNLGAQCAVNGVECKDSVVLKQGDYVLLGKTNMFRFNNPAEAAKLREKRQSMSSLTDLSCGDSVESLDTEDSDQYSFYNRRPFHPLYGPNLQLERQYRSESERINQAKKELEQLRDEHQRAEELRREREEELYRIHEEHRAEIQRDLERATRMKEETQAQRDKAEAEIEYARECLQKEKEAFYEKLQAELKNLQKFGTVSEVVTQTDLDSSGHVKEAINTAKQSGWGKVKDLLHTELKSRLQLRETEERLRRQSEDLEEQFEMSQREIQQKMGKIKEVEEEYKSEDAVHYEEMTNKMKEIEDLTEREEQLELYIEETQDLLMVGVDQPRPIRSACSEEVLTVLSPTNPGFPTRTTSLMALPRGSEGDLPSCSNRLSQKPDDQSMEESTNSLFEGSEASMDMSSSVGEGDDGGKRKSGAKSEKLVKTAKNVTDRLYKAPEPKFKYQPKSKQLSRSSGATYDASVRTRDRRSPISPTRDSPSRSMSPRISRGRLKSESPRSTPRSTPSPRQTPERQLNEKSSNDSRRGKKPTDLNEKDTRTNSEKAGSSTAKKSQPSPKSKGTDQISSGTKKDPLDKKHSSTGDLADVRSRRQSPGSHDDIIGRRSSPSGRQRDSENSRLSPNSDGGSRKFVSRLRHIASASSLANVPESIAEEVEPAEPEQRSTSQVVVVKRRKKRPQIEGEEFRRHSEPLGEELAEAFDKYTQDFEQMEWQRAGSSCLQGRENSLNWMGSYPENISYSIPRSMSNEDIEQQRDGSVDSENDVQTKLMPTINVEECDDFDSSRLHREPSVYSETGSTVSEVSTVVDTEIDASDQAVFMEGVETLSDDESPRKESDLSESPKPGSKREHDLVSERTSSVPMKMARTENDIDINPDNQDKMATSQFPESQFFTGESVPSDSVSVSSDSLDDSKSVDSLECPRERKGDEGEENLDDSLDESHMRDTLTSQASVTFLSDSNNSTELLTSGEGRNLTEDLDSSKNSDLNFVSQVTVSQQTTDKSKLANLPESNNSQASGVTESPQLPFVEVQQSSVSPHITESSDLSISPGVKESQEAENPHSASDKVPDLSTQEHLHSVIVDSVSRRNEKSAESFPSEESVETSTNITENKISASEIDSLHDSEKLTATPVSLSGNGNISPTSETSAPDITIKAIPQELSTEFLSSSSNKVVPSSQVTIADRDSDSKFENSKQTGPDEQFEQEEKEQSVTVIQPTVAKISDSKETGQNEQLVQGDQRVSESFIPDKESLEFIQAGPNLQLVHEQRDQSISEAHSTFSDSSVIDTDHTVQKMSASHDKTAAMDIESQGPVTESTSLLSSKQGTSDPQHVSSGDSNLAEQSKSEAGDSPAPEEKSEECDSISAPSDSDSNKVNMADKSCDGITVEQTDRASQVNIPESPKKDTSTVSGTASQTNLIFPQSFDDQNETNMEIEANNALQESMEISTSFSEFSGTENEKSLSIIAVDMEEESRKTVGVCTSPSLICPHDDTHSCSNDSLQEVKEQLQELQEVLEGHIGLPARGVYQVSPQLSSARRAVRQRAMIQRNGRLESGESDGTDPLAESAEATGSQSKSCSRPTSGSRRRRRAQLKPYKKSGKCPYCQSSEEYQLTTESESHNSDTALISKEEELSQPEQSKSDEEISHDATAVGLSDDDATKDSEHRNLEQECSSINHSVNLENIDSDKTLPKSGSVSSLNSEVEKYCSVLREIDDQEQNIPGGSSDTNMLTSQRPVDGPAHRPQKLRTDMNSVDSSYGSVGKSGSRTTSETRDSEQQTDLSSVDSPLMSPLSSLHSSLRSPRPGIHHLITSPVSVWSSDKSSSSPRKARASGGLNTPTGRRTPRKHKSSKLEMTCADVWSTETVDPNCPPTENSATLDSDVSSEEDNCYSLETETVSPQSPSSSDRFFDHGSFILESPPSGRAVPIQSPVRYEVTVKEEETNVFYNVNKVEYKTYGLNSPNLSTTIPETININVTNTDTHRVENHDELVNHERVVFSRSDAESPTHVLVSERNFQGSSTVSNADGHHVENQIQNEYGNSYVEERGPPLNVQISEDPRGVKSLTSPIESDTTSDYGTMIGDGRRGNTSFMSDSADDLDSLPGDRSSNKSTPRSKITDDAQQPNRYRRVGEQTVLHLNEENIESINPTEQSLQTVSPPLKRLSRSQCTVTSPSSEVASSVIQGSSAMDVLRDLIENPINTTTEDAEHSDEYDPTRKYFVEEICDEVHSSSSSSYTTPQQSPRLSKTEISETSEEPQKAEETTEKLLVPADLKNIQAISVDADSQEPKAIPRKQTKDDGSLHREMKREIQQKLANLQRRVRSLSDSAISSDYHTDGDSTTVSPRGSRLYESDKILRVGGGHLGPIEVRTSEIETPQIPAEILNTKALEIENKSVRKSPLKDSGNVFDDSDTCDLGKSEDDSKKESSDQEVSDVMQKKVQQRSNFPIEVTSSSEESDSDVRCETNSERSLSPGEILIDDYDVPQEEQTVEADEKSKYKYNLIKEKSPSMSDVPTEDREEIRRSMSEACMDQYEEAKDDNANSSNDSIVFVFMGQSHSKDSMEQLKSFTSKQPEYNILSSTEVLEDRGDESDEDGRSSNRDTIIQEEEAIDGMENWEQRPRSYTDNEDDDKPLRHKFGIDESVLPIPTRSMSSDNLPKQGLSQQKIHRSRSTSLLEVHSKIEVADDSSNNEGIFPPCVETSERESQNTSDVKDSTSAEIGDSDFSLTELPDDMQYSRFPSQHAHPDDTHQHTSYNSTMRPRDEERNAEVSQGLVEFGTQTNETILPTHAKDNRVLPGLDSPYRAKSTEELTRGRTTELHLTEDTENWQNLSSIVIENNARVQNLQQRLPGEYRYGSIDAVSAHRDDTTQTSTSLQNLETSSTQTDISFPTLTLSEVETTEVLPDLSEVDGNINTESLGNVRDTVDYFDRLSREPSPAKQESRKPAPKKKTKDLIQKKADDEVTETILVEKEYNLETEYNYPNLSASNSEMEKLKEEHEKMMEKFRMATENRKRMTEKLRKEGGPQGVHEEFVAEEANRQHSLPRMNWQSPTQTRDQKTDKVVRESTDIPTKKGSQNDMYTNETVGVKTTHKAETVDDVLSDDEGCITPPTSPVAIETEIPSQDISVPLRSRLQHLSREADNHVMMNGNADLSENVQREIHENGGPSLKLDLSAITGEPDSQPITNLSNNQIKQKLDKLHKERVQIIEMLSLNYLPASFTVELLEAKLNYCIGQTDLILKSLEDHWDSDKERMSTIYHPNITREHLTMYRNELQQSKTDIEMCREKMQRKQGTGRGRTKGRNRDFLRMRRNAEIEAFKVERMLELQNYERSQTLHNLNNSFQESLPERGSRSVSPTSSVHSSSQYMTPKQHMDHLVHLRKELVKHTEDPDFLNRISRSSSPSLHHRTTSYPSPRLHHDYLSPRSASTQDRFFDSETQVYDSYSMYSPRESTFSPRTSYHNRQLNYSPKIAFSVADELPSSVDYGYSTYLVPPRPRDRDSPRSVSSDSRPPSNTLHSPTQLSTGSISPEPRFRPVMDHSLDHQLESRNYYTGSESRQLLHEIEQIRLQNRTEIQRAQHILDSYSKKPSSVRNSHMSVDRPSSMPRHPYSSYSDYASDLLDASHRSISGTLCGSYELYEKEVSNLTSRHRPSSPGSVISDVGTYHGIDPNRIRPIQSSDIKAKLKRRHTTRR